MKQTHEAIIKNLGQENWKNKLTPFSGPQCNEDRGKKVLYEYNPDLRLKVVTDKKISCALIESSNNERAGSNALIDNLSNLPVSNDNLIAVFNEAAFRVCNKCSKTRILDFRACRKFPLGSYRYGGIIQKLSFDCTRLVNTDCNSPEDIVSGKINDEINFLVLRSEKSEAFYWLDRGKY